jgi:omega-amidase
MNNNKISFKMIQADLAWEDPDANLQHFNSLIEKSDPADVIVLPEMFATGFSMSPGNIARESWRKAFDWMKEKSSSTGSVICGSLMCEEGGKYYNRLVWMPPTGDAVFYNKKHLFSMTLENEFFVPGNEHIVIEYKGFRIRPLICYDLRFPAWSRNKLVNDRAEYDILIYVANWPEKRINHWVSLLKARAIENSAYVVGLNRIGRDDNNLLYNGLSCFVNFKGEAIALQENREHVEVFEAEMHPLEEYRKTFPVLKDADEFKFS